MGLFDFFRKKKQSAESANASTRHCFVLCKTSEPGNLDAASGIVAEIFGRVTRPKFPTQWSA